LRHQVLSRRRSGAGIGILLAATIGLLSGVAPAMAKPARGKPAAKSAKSKRIAVLPPAGGAGKHAIVFAKIGSALKQHKIVVVGGGPVKNVLAAGGMPASDDEWFVLARKLKVDGALESTLSETGGKRRIEVAVHNAADGAVLGRETFAVKGPPAKLAAVVAANFWRKLGPAIQSTSPAKRGEAGGGTPARSQPPAEAAPVASNVEEPAAPVKPPEAAAPAAEEDTGEQEEDEGRAAPGSGGGAAYEPVRLEGEEGEAAPPGRKRGGKGGRGRRAGEPRSIEVEVGGRALQRLFQYSPPSAAKAYTRHFLPVLQGQAAWFPITYAGVLLAFEFNPWLATGSNPSYPTGTREIVIGPQGRYPLSLGVLGLSVAYFQHLFVIGDPTESGAPARSTLPWPNVAYQGVRVAASGRFYLGSMFLAGAEAAYRLVTSPGEGETRVRSSYYFPNGKTSYGLDCSAFVSVAVMRWLEIRAGVDYRRYGFGALQTQSGSPNDINATGASDQYLGFTLGAVGVFGGR
jgi:hypothetical protein